MLDMVPLEPVTALAQAQFGVLSAAQLAALGLDDSAVRRRVTSGLLKRRLPTVFVFAGAPPSWRQDLKAATLWGEAVVSHEAAAALHRLVGFPERPVVLTGLRQPQFKGAAITVHRGVPDRRFVTTVEGIPVTNVARTLVDVAATTARSDFEEVMDDARRRHLVSDGHLRWAVQALLADEGGKRTSGKRGAQIIKEIFEWRGPLDGPSASAFQKDVRVLLVSGGLRIIEEHEIRDMEGDFIARVDFELEANVVVEAQSRRYHSSWDAQTRDMRRHNKITRRGKLVIYITPTDIADRPREVLAEVVETVAMAKASRGTAAARP